MLSEEILKEKDVIYLYSYLILFSFFPKFSIRLYHSISAYFLPKFSLAKIYLIKQLLTLFSNIFTVKFLLSHILTFLSKKKKKNECLISNNYNLVLYKLHNYSI